MHGILAWCRVEMIIYVFMKVVSGELIKLFVCNLCTVGLTWYSGLQKLSLNMDKI